MSGWVPLEPPVYQDDWDLFEMFWENGWICDKPKRSGKDALVEKTLAEATRRGIKVGVLKGKKIERFVDDVWMYKPPIVMPTDWLAEVRDMCRKAPFRLRGEMVLKRD